MRKLNFSTPAVFFLINTFLFHYSYAQTSVPDSSSGYYINAVSYFENQIGANSHLFIGKEFNDYDLHVKGNPFFGFNQMQKSELFYDGTLYKNVPLLFDIVGQQLVINSYNEDYKIALISEKVKYFVIGGHRFENFLLDENANNIYNFYEILFANSIEVLAKRIKRIKNGLRAEDPASFVEQDELFIKKNNYLYPVYNKKTVMQALRDKKEIVQAFIRKHSLKFKRNIENDLKITAAYYATISH